MGPVSKGLKGFSAQQPFAIIYLTTLFLFCSFLDAGYVYSCVDDNKFAKIDLNVNLAFGSFVVMRYILNLNTNTPRVREKCISFWWHFVFRNLLKYALL